MQSLKNKKLMTKSIPWTIFDGIFNLVYAVCMVLMIGVYIEPYELGVASIAVSIVLVVESLYLTGLHEYVVQSEFSSSSTSDTAYTIAVFFSIIGYLLCASVAYPLSILYNSSKIISYILFIALLLPINAFYTIPTARLVRKIRTEILTIRIILAKILSFFAFAISAFYELGAWCLLLSMFASSTGSLLLIIRVANRWPRFNFDLVLIKKILTYSVVSSLSNFLWILSVRLFAMLVGYIHGNQFLGYFQFAQRLVDEIASLLQITITRVGLPYFSNIVRAGNDIRPSYYTGVKTLSYLSSSFYLGLIAISESAITFMFDQKWIDSVSIISILSVAWFLCFNKVLIPVLLRAKGVPKYNLLFSSISLFTAISALFVARDFSPEYTAIAWGVSQIATIPFQLYIMRKEFSVSPIRHFLCVVKPYFAAFIMFYAIKIFFDFTSLYDPLLHVVISIGVGVVSFILSVLVIDFKFLSEILLYFIEKSPGESHAQLNG